MTDDLDPTRVTRLIGVYHADGSLKGEVAYWVGARLGRAHCSLCDITHGLLRERADWRACRAEIAVPFDTYHRDDQPDAVRSATGGMTPVVVAETDDGVVVLLGPPEIDACNGSGEMLVASVAAALAKRGLSLPE